MKPYQTIMQKSKAIADRFQSRSLRLLIMGLVISTLVAACGGASAPATDPAASAPAADQGSTAGQNVALGTEEFGLSKEELVQKIEAVEPLIAKCMSDAGFEYIAVDYDTVRRGMTADKTLPGVSNEQFLSQYGYGISTLYSGLAPQTDSTITPGKVGLGEQNVQIFNKLSPADQVAYSRTLFGQNTEATFAISLELEDFTRTGGCTRSAIEQVFTGDQLKATYTNPLDARIDQDPRMIAALEEFATCMRDAGFNYNHPDAIENDIKNRLDIIVAGVPLDALAPDAKAALTELQGEERAVAAKSTECAETLVEPVKVKIEQELSK